MIEVKKEKIKELIEYTLKYIVADNKSYLTSSLTGVIWKHLSPDNNDTITIGENAGKASGENVGPFTGSLIDGILAHTKDLEEKLELKADSDALQTALCDISALETENRNLRVDLNSVDDRLSLAVADIDSLKTAICEIDKLKREDSDTLSFVLNLEHRVNILRHRVLSMEGKNKSEDE